MNEPVLFFPAWRKSSHSGADSGCVEIAGYSLGPVAVRDSKDTAGPILTFPIKEWKTFIIQVKDNGFDVECSQITENLGSNSGMTCP